MYLWAARAIVKEVIPPAPRGTAEAQHLVRSQRATTNKLSGMYREGVYSRGAKRPPKFLALRCFLAGAAFNFALPADAPPGGTAQAN